MFSNRLLIKDVDPELQRALDGERQRQEDHIELIASENYASPRVLEAQGSSLTNKYAEGYPGRRYYGGNQFVDQAEDLARRRACELFGAEHANVQPHSGANANMAVYLALLNPGDIVPSCTGVIGVPMPMAKVRAAITGLAGKLRPGGLDDVAKAILTTDRGPKVCSVRIGDAVVCAMAKGAGMIEPNMATMLVYFFTNVDVDGAGLHAALAEAVDRTFNNLTVDSDTSTSDTVAMFSTRAVPIAGDARADWVDAVRCMGIKLARDIVAQSEGATKLIDCTVKLDSTARDAKLTAKKIVNSPLVKTAVHGGDPNWGRIVMAIGKPDERLKLGAISRGDVVIKMMGQVVFSKAQPIAIDLPALARSIKSSSRVSIEVTIGEGRHSATVWGCDLSHRYVDINADYMT